MKSALDWLDQRIGFRQLIDKTLFAQIPGGPRWRYAWGSLVGLGIFIQVVTGITLWMYYSPGTQSAWESVNYFQSQVSFGWLVRGLHHYMAQILPVLLALHLMQMIIDRSYRAGREVNFWLSLVMLQVILMIALTGYQLPWDQKGFWATKVAVNILGIVPIVGRSAQTILIGGPDYGQLTLTHFFAIHAGILPALLLLLVVFQIVLICRNGVAGTEHISSLPSRFWPDQLWRNLVVALALIATLLFLILRHAASNDSAYWGAPLGAPADPSEPFSAARPEWYFLFLFQFLKYFPAQMEIVGALIVPGLVMAVIFLMPFFGRSRAGHRFNVGFLSCLFVAIGLLTYHALSLDRHNVEYQTAVKSAHAESNRIRQLANSPRKLPLTGALELLTADPFIQGPKLFAKNCSGCHRYAGTDGLGNKVADPQSASDLKGFASRQWLSGLLDPQQVDGTNYFGATKLRTGKMIKFVKHDVAAYSSDEKAQLINVIAAVSAEARLPSQKDADKTDAPLIASGKKSLRDSLKCTDCHQFQVPDETASAPNLTGYGSRAWLVKFLSNPGHADFYGADNDRMPAFGAKGILTPVQIGLIVDWLRGDWYEPPQAASQTAQK